MSGIIDSALSIMSGSERRLATIAGNVANVATPGFKRQVSFSDALSARSDLSPNGFSPQVRTRSDFGQGRMVATGNPLDLAIGGDGFFRLRDGDRIVYSRQGQFHRAEDGSIVNGEGHVLQTAGGGDLVLDDDRVEIRRDGAVLSSGVPVAHIALAAPLSGSSAEPLGGALFALPGGEGEEIAEPDIRQGVVEGSNVTLGDEMAAMMATLRQAESGARLVMVYDELLGRAITSFGQGTR
jgi:flagellar basal-body rod protein FlgG